MKKKLTKKLLKLVTIMITQLAIYWILVIVKKNYTLTAIDLSKQTKLRGPQQISFIGKLLDTRWVTMFFIIEKSEEITFNSSQNSATII